jgi:hypothetical protein
MFGQVTRHAKRISTSSPRSRARQWLAVSGMNFAALPGPRHTFHDLIQILIDFDRTLTSATNFLLRKVSLSLTNPTQQLHWVECRERLPQSSFAIVGHAVIAEQTLIWRRRHVIPFTTFAPSRVFDFSLKDG